MSQETVARLREVYDAVSRGDWDAAFRDAPPDFELKTPDQNPIAGTYRGHEEVRGFFDEIWAAFDAVAVHPEEVQDLGDRVLVFLLMQLRPNDSDARLEMRIAHLWTMLDGNPVRCEVFTTRAQALEAAGLSE